MCSKQTDDVSDRHGTRNSGGVKRSGSTAMAMTACSVCSETRRGNGDGSYAMKKACLTAGDLPVSLERARNPGTELGHGEASSCEIKVGVSFTT